jgi:hypothetical protein
MYIVPLFITLLVLIAYYLGVGLSRWAFKLKIKKMERDIFAYKFIMKAYGIDDKYINNPKISQPPTQEDLEWAEKVKKKVQDGV